MSFSYYFESILFLIFFNNLLFFNSIEANAAQDSDDISTEWKGGGQRSGNVRTPVSAHLPMQNLGKVKFDPPKVPVIFVLGKSPDLCIFIIMNMIMSLSFVCMFVVILKLISSQYYRVTYVIYIHLH